MPFSLTIDPLQRMVNVVYSGILVNDDLMGLAQAIVDDPDFEADFDQLIDAREVVEVRLTADDLRENIRLNLFGLGSRRAGVTKGAFAFGMARMFEMLRGDQPDEIKIFQSLEEAAEWLGIKSRRDD